MTREEKMADEIWWIINRYHHAMVSADTGRIAEVSRELDRQLIRALRSKKK